MATYSPESLGIKAPSGGFQQGGFYGGREYVNGTLSEPGELHPNSPRKGFEGTRVSNETIAQTNPDNVPYIEAQRKAAAANPVTPASSYTPGTTQPGSTTSGAGAGAGSFDASVLSPATINLPELYKSLYQDSGIQAKEAELADLEKQFTEVKGGINDNPYLSEATRVGRVAKAESLHAERTKNLRDEIATKKADIETQINLQTKQFDINSSAATQALNQFNTLLSLGALNDASGDSIAAITRTTGIPSDMIYSAISANKKKDQKVTVETFTDDNGNVTAVAIDQNGNIVNQTSLGALGKADSGGGSGSTSTTKAQFLADASSTATGTQTDAGWVGVFPQLVAKYAPYYSLQDIYNLYAQSEAGKKYGTPKESAQEIKEIYDAYRG